jgi:hypothetical protein
MTMGRRFRTQQRRLSGANDASLSELPLAGINLSDWALWFSLFLPAVRRITHLGIASHIPESGAFQSRLGRRENGIFIFHFRAMARHLSLDFVLRVTEEFSAR